MPIVARDRATTGRIDWKAERDRIDLAAVATRLLGPAPGRRGERGGRRLWWPCPFHEDGNPSLMVEPGKPFWKCWGCGEHGDAATLVMKREGLTFPEAIAWITGREPPKAPPARSVIQAPSATGRLTEDQATAIVADAASRLWTPEGADALAYLAGRGLEPETIRAAGLGWLPEGNPAVAWKAPGIVIPWRDKGRVVLVKIRPPDAWREAFPPDRKRPPKYLEAFRAATPELYPSPEAIRPGRPAVIVEGEFDALLLGQELGNLASVVTLGSASAGLDVPILGRLMTAPAWFVATDADDAGDKAAALWEAFPSAKRLRPPEGKDWTEFHATGSNRIRYHWMPILGRRGPSWDDLASWRWGSGPDDDTPEAPEGDPYAIAERHAIQTESDPD